MTEGTNITDCRHSFHASTGSGYCPRCGGAWKTRHLKDRPMTVEPISDEELTPIRKRLDVLVAEHRDLHELDAFNARLIARIDLERNHSQELLGIIEAVERRAGADEAVRKLTRTRKAVVTAKDRMDAAEAEVARLADVGVKWLAEYNRAESLRAVIVAAEPDLAAAYSLINGSPLPMDMQPMRARVLRTLDRVLALTALAPKPKEN